MIDEDRPMAERVEMVATHLEVAGGSLMAGDLQGAGADITNAAGVLTRIAEDLQEEDDVDE